MSVLVAYASKHGATKVIAERIGDTLRARGLAVDVEAINAVSDLGGYQAFVIGGAVYFGSWLKEVTAFLQHHQATLGEYPVWLFSSGPLGTNATDAEGCDLREASVPKELESLARAVHARDHHVFFGALDHTTFGICERLLRVLPAGRSLLIEGDFRDWSDIELWATGIAEELQRDLEIAPISAAAQGPSEP
jgi:menaquinone-dependent protoporphyrinogen oxidase